MANPALQLMEARFPGSGRFGLDPFGQSPFGGSDWPPVQLPRVQLGSDDLALSLRERISRIRLERDGHTVAQRTLARARLWDVHYRAAEINGLEVLRPFFRVGLFWLLPDGDDQQNRIAVWWVGEEFHPQYVAPATAGRGALYALKFSLEERI
jgi:hypothetical protein